MSYKVDHTHDPKTWETLPRGDETPEELQKFMEKYYPNRLKKEKCCNGNKCSN